MLVAERGLAESREQAQRLILAGSVRVDGRTVTKAGQAIAAAAVVEVTAPPRFVSRGGEKLDAAFEAFGVSVAGWCVSTPGRPRAVLPIACCGAEPRGSSPWTWARGNCTGVCVPIRG